MADPSTILAILQLVGTAAMAVCQAADKAIELEHEEKQALKELRKGVEGLKSDTLVYKVLLNAMNSDTDLDKRSPYARFIQRYVMGLRSSSNIHRANYLQYHRTDGKEAMESLERALKATRLLLEENPAGNRKEVTVNPSGNREPRRALHLVLNVLKANLRPGYRQELTSDLKDATFEISVCQQNNERAFKLVWNLYVVAQQWTGRHISVDDIVNIQDHGETPDSVLHEGGSRVNPLRPPPIMADPSTVLATLQLVGTAATAVCEAVGKEIELEHEERQALKELREGVESLKSGTLVYKDLLNTMESDTDLDGRSPYAHFIQQYVMGLPPSSYFHRANDFTIPQNGRKGSNGKP